MYNEAQKRKVYFCSCDERNMNLFLRKILLAFCCSFVMICANGQGNVYMTIEPSQVNKDEYATLKIIIENAHDIQHVTPPSLKKFIVLSGPNQENGMRSVNGNMTTNYVALVFTVKPKVYGKINIDAATVKIGGRFYKTNTASLVVNNAVSSYSSGSSLPGSLFQNLDPLAAARSSSPFNDYIFHKNDNIADKVNKNMQLRLEVDKTSCYVGEPIVAVYKLYTRLKSESQLTENPSFNGFSVIDLTGQDISGYTRERLNGREYNVYTIRKAQLYPLQSGSIDLEPAELENNIQFIKDEYLANRSNDLSDLFDDFSLATVPAEWIIHQTVNLKSKPVTIEVKALPETNKPASFTGAVGKFLLEAGLQKTNFPANEPGKLLLKISGSGNLQLLTAPVLTWPGGIDPFEPKVIEALNKTVVPVSGSKIFEYNFSANAPGEYSLPAIDFSYFDPVSASYKTITTKPFAFTVTKATGQMLMENIPGSNKEPVTGINKIFNNRWWIIVFIGILVLAGLLIWVKKDKAASKINKEPVVKDEEELKLDRIIETAAINQRNPLEKTTECLYRANCTGFYSLLNTELKSFLANKFSVAAIDINTRGIAAVMDRKNISNDTVLQLQELLKQIEWQVYTPFERNEKMNAMYQEAQDIIQLINTYDIRHL